jgi:tetratricopeptide (TPR) repeat protein
MKGMPAARVRESARESWQALRQALDACTEAVLLGPRPGWPEQVTWSVIPGNAHVHIAEHLGYLAAERGDPSAAEEVAKWAHRLDVRLSPSGPERGNGDYNLACFYARVGRADRALALLADAFRRNPALKEWAGKDADLDKIRDHPEFRQLLG